MGATRPGHPFAEQVPIGTTNGEPVTGSGITRAASPKTSASISSVTTADGGLSTMIRPSRVATSRSAWRATG